MTSIYFITPWVCIVNDYSIYLLGLLLRKYFICQLSVATSCPPVHRINVAYSASRPRVRPEATDDSCQIKCTFCIMLMVLIRGSSRNFLSFSYTVNCLWVIPQRMKTVRSLLSIDFHKKKRRVTRYLGC